MRLADFVEKGQVRKASEDKPLAKSLLLTVEIDLEFLGGLEIGQNSARKIMTNYYDVLRSLLEAISAIDGYKVYSHEAFKYFLIEKSEPVIAEKFDRFRRIRNGLNYYGKNITPEEAKDNVGEIIRLIDELKKKYLQQL